MQEKYVNNLKHKLDVMYDNDEINESTNKTCRFDTDKEQIYRCPPELCCSKDGVCGYGMDYCENENNTTLKKLNGINAMQNYLDDRVSIDNTCINKICPDGLCCSKNGLCGTGKEHCGITNVPEKNGTNALENYNKLDNIEKNQIIYLSDDFCGKDIKTDKIYKCNNNKCCFNNKCGIGYDYCEFADPENKYHGTNALENYKKNKISTDNTCFTKICPDGECCSNNNKCGKGDEYCNNFNNKYNGYNSLKYIYDKNNFVTDSSLNICGKDSKNNQLYKCNPGYCCLKDGTCSLDCSSSFISNYDDDKIEKITFFVNKQSKILKLKINELKDLHSKFLKIDVKHTSSKNFAIRHSDDKKINEDKIFNFINELLNKEYTRNKFNGDNAINNYINNKKLQTYIKGEFVVSDTNNCYIDSKNNINYRCPTNTYCNYGNNTCYPCNIPNDIELKKLHGKKTYKYLLLILVLLFVLLFGMMYFLKIVNR